MNPLWGIDLGGTKMEGIVLESLESCKVISRIRIPTEGAKGYHHILNQLIHLVKKMSVESGLTPEKIGIGIPGCIDSASQVIKNSNSTSLIGHPLKYDLEKSLKIPVFMANDANCFAMAEMHMGIVKEMAPGAEVVFGVIMGTGVGGGVVVNGKVINGLHGIGGEWGHNFLDESGGKCYCGMNGCVETMISGPALERYYAKIAGIQQSLKEIYQRHLYLEDKFATATISRLIQYFGKAIAVVINIIDPDVIVLGGGLGNIDLLYTQGRDEVKKHLFNHELHTLFLKPKLGDSAGVFGAAALTI
jgi:fructokinase